MRHPRSAARLDLLDVAREPSGDGSERVALRTDGGVIECRLHAAAHGDAGVVWVFGAGGGLGGPAGGVYERLGRRLTGDGITSLELAYRRPGELSECVLDTLLGVVYLTALERRRVLLVGHSFGGAVVIAAGAASEHVAGVVAMSSQTAGTSAVGALAPRPLLLLHGTADEILPDRCSRDIHARAGEPKTLKLYPGCRHGLDQCRDALDHDLVAWIHDVLGVAA